MSGFLRNILKNMSTTQTRNIDIFNVFNIIMRKVIGL